MKLAGSILDAVLILLSFGAVGSQLDPSMRKFDGDESGQYISAAFFFAGFVYLHWALWRLLVPSGITKHFSARFIEWGKRRTGFFRGTIGFGYLMVAAYCFFGLYPASRNEYSLSQSPFWMGLTLILIGTAARSREVMLHLASERPTELASNAPPPKSFANTNPPTIRADA